MERPVIVSALLNLRSSCIVALFYRLSQSLCSTSGPIPVELALLAALTRLELDNNRLSGNSDNTLRRGILADAAQRKPCLPFHPFSVGIHDNSCLCNVGCSFATSLARKTRPWCRGRFRTLSLQLCNGDMCSAFPLPGLGPKHRCFGNARNSLASLLSTSTSGITATACHGPAACEDCLVRHPVHCRAERNRSAAQRAFCAASICNKGCRRGQGACLPACLPACKKC